MEKAPKRSVSSVLLLLLLLLPLKGELVYFSLFPAAIAAASATAAAAAAAAAFREPDVPFRILQRARAAFILCKN